MNWWWKKRRKRLNLIWILVEFIAQTGSSNDKVRHCFDKKLWITFYPSNDKVRERFRRIIVISYHGRQGGFFDPFSNAREKKGGAVFFPSIWKEGRKITRLDVRVCELCFLWRHDEHEVVMVFMTTFVSLHHYFTLHDVVLCQHVSCMGSLELNVGTVK